ncbi:MAG: ABC transporter substrate-binding protein [Thaumarchaeota archaeon]|nr:MAG: ABC transporter substrate-binding protein [Nitrososphaerota archaeon]
MIFILVSAKLLIQRKAISRTVVSAIVLIIIVAAAAGAYYTLTLPRGTSGTTSVQTSGGATGLLPTYVPSSKSVDTLAIDEWVWPIDDLNQLYALSELPWPNWLTYTVYQPLVSVNETAEYQQGTIQYLPGLATSWTVSSDGKTYTFNLRQNVQFSNGDPFNAYQVWGQMYGFYYLSGNSSTWLESYNFFDMSTARFGPSTIALMQQSGLINPNSRLMSIMTDSTWPIYVTGPYQIVFNLKSPFVWFPGAFVVFDGLIFDVQWLLQNGGFGTPTSFNSYFNQHPIPGTGPYAVTQVVQNSYVKFSQNQKYWGKSLSAAEIAAQPIWDPGHAANVIVYYKPNNIARVTDLQNKVVHISAVEPSEWPVITANPSFSFVEQPPWAGEVSLLGLNGHVYPTNITAVRQAIVHAINYTDVYAKAYQGLMTPYVGPEYPAWRDFYNLGGVSEYKYDLNLAKQLLTQNHVDTSKFPSLTFNVQAGCESCTNVAEVIQSDLSSINMTVDIHVISTAQYYSPFGSYQTNLQNAQQIGQLAFVNSGFGWSPATLTPADYWVTFVNNASIWGNWPAYSHPTVQKCVDAFTSTSDVSMIQSLCTAAQKQIFDDAPYAWIGLFKLWLPPGGSLVWDHNTVKGFLVDPVWNGQNTGPVFNTVTFG